MEHYRIECRHNLNIKLMNIDPGRSRLGEIAADWAPVRILPVSMSCLPGAIMELSAWMEDASVLRSQPAIGSVAGCSRRPRGGAPRHRSSRSIGLFWLVFTGALLGMLGYGWINRNERHWVPDEGIGYWLGIVGAVVMLLLLVYPLRKRFRVLRVLGTVPAWFKIHMTFGLLGPALILLHCNFKSQSTNASVALYAMLIVAGSGLIGRLLYSHVHINLSGQRRQAASFFDALAQVGTEKSDNNYIHLTSRSIERAAAISSLSLAPQRNLVSAIGHGWFVRWQVRQLARSIGVELRQTQLSVRRKKLASQRELTRERKQLEADLAAHLDAVKKAAALGAYERLFSLWHFLHVPLFIMLVGAVLVHILAVHLY